MKGALTTSMNQDGGRTRVYIYIFFYPPSGYKISHSYLITNIKEKENDVVEDRNGDGGYVLMPKKTNAGQIKSCKKFLENENWQNLRNRNQCVLNVRVHQSIAAAISYRCQRCIIIY